MRITGGTVRGRRLTTPSSSALIRPTSDRVREAIFSILADRIQGSLVLDLFAGTGALGIEALSRGARHAVFVDQSKDAAGLIRANLLNCFQQPAASFTSLNLASKSALSKLKNNLAQPVTFELIFMDPPYKKDLAEPLLQQIQKTKLLASTGLLIVEEHRRVVLPDAVGLLQLSDRRTYGETGIWIYTYSHNRTTQKSHGQSLYANAS